LNAQGRAHRFFEEVARAKAQGRAATMGVCNTTPDSFSDGGESFEPADAIARVDRLIAEGAEIVDVGGESTRPGAPRVAAEEQIARVAEVIRYASSRVVVSIDTTSAKVAQRALELGAHAVNDVSLLSEPELAEVVARFDAALVLSHARGFQADMRGFGAWPEHAYGDVVLDVLADFSRAREHARSLGVSASSIVMDPGLGFSKSSAHSLELLRRTDELVDRADAIVLIGASRKSFLKSVTGEVEPRERLGASIQAAVHAQRCGASIVRVHDVRATRQALALDASLRAARAADHDEPSASEVALRSESIEVPGC
jgi:dihydropteroate synthase